MPFDSRKPGGVDSAVWNSGETYRLLAEASPDFIFLIDLDGVVRYVNPAGAKLFGTTPEHMIGRRKNDFFPTTHSQRQDQNLGHVLATGQSLYIENVTAFPGQDMVLDSWLVPIKDLHGSVCAVLGISRDITARKEAEQSLAESEVRYRALVETSPDFIVFTDVDYRPLMLNSAMAEALEYPDIESLVAVAKDGLEVIVQTPLKDQLTFHDALLRHGKVRAKEFTLRRRSGGALDIELSAALVRGPDGRIQGIINIGRDITRRKAQEQAIRESEEKFRTLVEDISEGVLIIVDGRNRWTNWAFSNLFGYEPQEILGHGPELLIAPECLDMARERMRRRAAGLPLSDTFEAWCLRKDGVRRLIEFATRDLLFEDRQATQLAAHDITEKRAAERALEEEKELLEVTLASIGDAVVTTDTEGRIILCNRHGEALIGCRHGEAVGCLLAERLPLYTDSDPPLAVDFLSTAIHEGRHQYLDRGVVLTDASGRRRDVSVSISPLTKGGGEIRGAVVVLQDITDRIQLEAEMLRTDKLEALGLLAGGIAHDFNNILTAVWGNLSLGRHYLTPDSPAAQRLQESEQALVRARDLTRQLLTFSRGGAPVRRASSLAALLRETVSFALRGTPVQSVYEIDDDLWTVEVDEGQICQVINNLVINAVQSMPSGGRLTVRAVNVQADSREVGESRDDGSPPLLPGQQICVSFIDEGVGVPSKNLQKIFDPYFTTKKSGTGLGLATSYSIITRHEGAMHVRSVVGEGSQFTILLPARPGLTPAQAPVSSAPIVGQGQVLVMDNEPSILTVMKLHLQALGYEATTTDNGHDAIVVYRDALKRGRPFDVVIMDLTLPGGMGGKDVIGRLRQIDPHVKGIVFSGYSNDPIMAHYEEHGFSGMLAKPFTMEGLAAELQRVLAQPRRS